MNWKRKILGNEEDLVKNIQKQVNRIFDELPPISVVTERFTGFSPKVSLYEDKNNLTATIEVPGLTEKDFEVSVTRDTLIVRGEKRDLEHNGTKHLSERATGKFNREIELPALVEEDQVEATLSKGVLTIVLQKLNSEVINQNTVEVTVAE